MPAAISLSDNFFVRAFALLPIIILVFGTILLRLYLGKMKFSIRTWGLVVVIYGSFITLSIIQSIIRNTTDLPRIIGNFSIPILVVLMCIVLYSNLSENELSHFYATVFWMFFVYVLINLALWIVGIYNRSEVFIEPRSSLLLSYLGLNYSRVTFPMATGINSFGYTAGMVLISGLILVTKSEERTKYIGIGVLSTLVGLITILLVDARSALFFSFVAFILSSLRINSSKMWWIVVLALLFPVIVLYTFSNLPDQWVWLISRSGKDALTLSNRTIIWQTAIDALSPFQLQHLIGWGYRGQIPSGIMKIYAPLFSNYQNVNSIPLHNSFLQHLIEVGYFGLLFFIIILILLLRDISRLALRSSSVWLLVIKGIVIFLIISSGFDSVLSMDSQETYVTFLLILFGTILRSSRTKQSYV
jgi:hypothetical protein